MDTERDQKGLLDVAHIVITLLIMGLFLGFVMFLRVAYQRPWTSWFPGEAAFYSALVCCMLVGVSALGLETVPPKHQRFRRVLRLVHYTALLVMVLALLYFMWTALTEKGNREITAGPEQFAPFLQYYEQREQQERLFLEHLPILRWADKEEKMIALKSMARDLVEAIVWDYTEDHDGAFPAELHLIEPYLPDRELQDFHFDGHRPVYVPPTSEDPNEAILYYWPPYEGGTAVGYRSGEVDSVELDEKGALVNPRTGEVIRGEAPSIKQQVAFGPMIERVVGGNASGKDMFVDLDTGKLFSFRGDLFEQLQSLRHCGVDALGATHPEVSGLIGVDLLVYRVPKEHWDGNDPAELMESDVLWTFRKPGFPGWVSGKGELPATYLFRTREGGMGIMQIVGYTEEPPGVKIRYKLAR